MFKRVTAVLTATLLCSAMILSSAFVVLETDHECSGDDCPVCLCIALCNEVLRQLSSAHEAVNTPSALSITFTVLILTAITFAPLATLITLKVKLTD